MDFRNEFGITRATEYPRPYSAQVRRWWLPVWTTISRGWLTEGLARCACADHAGGNVAAYLGKMPTTDTGHGQEGENG